MKTKLKGFLTLLLALVVQITFAQEKTVSGTVSDSSGILPGVSVVIKGTTKGTETDFDGKYSIKANTGDVLVFNYLGYKVVERTVGNSNTINVSLEEGGEVLDEIVVVGYSSKSRDVLTSGVSTVTVEELSQVSSTTNISNALQGKAAGVVVTAANGKPGQNAFVRIRGTGSVNAGQEPLYVVDGIPIGENDLNLINSSDVESISILKDAASAAAYGARASNGVVVITTKQGRKGEKARISFNTQVGWTEKVKDNFTMMNAEQKLQYERELNRGGSGSTTLLQSEWDNLVSLDHDWQDDLLKKGFIKSNGISISGGSDKSTYFVSFKSEEDTGIIQNLDGFKRITGRLNLTSELNNWLDLRVSTGVSHTDSKEPRDRNNVQNPFAAVYGYNGYEPLYKLDNEGNPVLDANGDPTYNLTHSGFSISEAIKNNPELEERLRLISTAALDFKFMEGKLIYTPQISMTYTTLRGEYYNQPGSILDGYVGDSDAPGSKRDNGNQSFTYNILNKISYNDTLNDVHNIGALFLTEFNANNYRSYRVSSKGFPTSDLTTQDNAAEADGTQSTTRSERSLFSIAGIFDYNYDEKYIASFGIRRDGSSMFGANNRYGTFWSASAAWNIHKESFFAIDWVNNLKFRVSYGLVGNDRLPTRYGSLGTYAFSNYNGQSAAYPDNVENPNLKWEEKAILDVGIDFGLFNNRFRGVVNYFNSNTYDLLFSENLAQETGEPGSPASRYVNFGDLSSKGIEVELNGDIIKNENFTWTLGSTIAFVKTNVDKLPGGADYIPAAYNLILQEGEELYTHYLVRYAGVNPANGRALYYDKDGNVTQNYNPSDAVPLTGKTVSPNFDGSVNTSLKYKGLNLSANFYYKYGNYIYNNVEQQHLSDGNSIRDNQRLDAFNFWRNPGDTNVLPDARNPLNTSESSDRFLQDGSYVRLRSLKLGYELPKKWLKENSFVKSLGMYIQGQNLWTYAPYFKGDPEIGIGSDETIGPEDVGFVSGAYNLNSYPTVKSYLLGIDITF